jgi:hypothetical protein
LSKGIGQNESNRKDEQTTTNKMLSVGDEAYANFMAKIQLDRRQENDKDTENKKQNLTWQPTKFTDNPSE